jgi:hypothetical protein
LKARNTTPTDGSVISGDVAYVLTRGWTAWRPLINKRANDPDLAFLADPDRRRRPPDVGALSRFRTPPSANLAEGPRLARDLALEY